MQAGLVFSLVLSTLLSGACSDDAEPLCVEQHITIEQGLYGRSVTGSDLGDGPAMPRPGHKIDVLEMPSPLATVIATTYPNDDGVYQLALPAGTFAICDGFCVSVLIEPATLTRLDFTSGPSTVPYQVPVSTCAD